MESIRTIFPKDITDGTLSTSSPAMINCPNIKGNTINAIKKVYLECHVLNWEFPM